MAKHTPGPWAWRGDMLWNEALDAVVLNHADCAWSVAPDNKRLIASAPRLLAALKRAEPLLAALYRQGGLPGVEASCDVLEAVSAAIAEAEEA